MARSESFVDVLRGGILESRHRVSAALVNATGELTAWVGDPGLVCYFRSAAKPLQALPLLADGGADAFGFGGPEIAVACASHSGEPAHVEVVERMLERIGCIEDDLECGPHAPFHGPSADALRARGRAPTRLHNNCSGKHTGMLAWSKHAGVDPDGYRLPDHPVQRRIREEVIEWTGVAAERVTSAIDGCGVVTFALPLDRMAVAFAWLASRARSERDGPAARIVSAMTGQPYLVGGTGRLCTDLMRAAGGAVLAKGGAEGVFCAAGLEDGWGLALKVEDGGRRAVAPAAIEFLAQAELLADAAVQALDHHHAGSIANTRGEDVGAVRACFRLRRA